ncbi:FK506-binding protein 5-like [Aphidius gifuensis]|uniref:FK506-binding protein 5-like n=1 Tax=Aphidius gifuensis TaxID=684658 RepID=UPI001CDCCF19|nr:FK506-binding protein 5-like [Aphidius gifuensis]
MTRKCILCQETNFKTKYSFFSAPKDAPTRKKWKEALGIPSVCDETYVCSKHFDDRDIISSWASGTPPHVVTIQYKKCRLRPGAVPTTKKNSRQYCIPTTRKDNQYFIHEKHDGDDDEDEEPEEEKEKEENQQQKMIKETHDERQEENHNKEDEKEEEEEFIETKKPATRSSMRKTLPVPPAKVNNNNNKLKATAKKTNDKPSIKKPVSKNGTVVSKTRAGGDNNCQEKMITEPIDIIDPANMDVDDNGDKSAFYIKTGDTKQLYYIKPVDENSKTDFTEDDIINGGDDDNVDDSKEKKVEKNPLIKLENVKYIEDDDEDEEDEEDEDDDDDDEYPMWKKIKAETKKKAKIISKTASKLPSSKTPATKISEPKIPATKISEPKIPASKLSQLQIPTSKIIEQKMTAQKLSEAQTPASKILEPKISEAQIAAAKINYEEEEDDGMLFEDLLETYTDVTLPSGWCVLVESRGDVTTVIYAYIETTSGGIPWIRKQVFIQNDMLMRTSAGGREIDPIVYKLIKGTNSVQVTDVDDVTDIIREFDERTVCQGTSEKINPADMDNTIGYLDGVNWRHVECSIMIKPGQARCKKCNSLNAIAKRKKAKLP